MVLDDRTRKLFRHVESVPAGLRPDAESDCRDDHLALCEELRLVAGALSGLIGYVARLEKRLGVHDADRPVCGLGQP